MSLLGINSFSIGTPYKWVSKNKIALAVASVLVVAGGKVATSYRGFYSIGEKEFQALTIDAVNRIIAREKIVGPGSCTYAENTLKFSVLSCNLGNKREYGPRILELKGVNAASFVCKNILMRHDGVLDRNSGTCYRGRTTLLGDPEYYDKSGKPRVLEPIPGIPLNIPIDANQG